MQLIIAELLLTKEPVTWKKSEPKSHWTLFTFWEIKIIQTNLGSIEESGILNWKDHENTNVKLNSVTFTMALNLLHFIYRYMVWYCGGQNHIYFLEGCNFTHKNKVYYGCTLSDSSYKHKSLPCRQQNKDNFQLNEEVPVLWSKWTRG